MKRTLFVIAILAIGYTAHAQNAPFPIWGSGLDGSLYQQTVIYSDATNGLLLEGPLNSSGAKLPIALSWRGGGTPFWITPAGNIGMGTTTPNHRLEITSGMTDPFYFNSNYNKFKSSAGYTYLESYHSTSLVIDFRGNYADRYFNIAKGASYIGGGSPVELFRVQENGNVGIGTAAPLAFLDIYHPGTGTTLRVGGNATGTASDASIDLYAVNGSAVPAYARLGLGVIDGSVGSETGYLDFSTINGGALTEKMRLTAEGNLLVGKTTQRNAAYLLDVGGKARANEIVVNTDGADFVFDKAYKLPGLATVKKYIGENHHLPGIPPAAEMSENGVAVGELNTRLLQKIEELTLYQIGQQHQNRIMERRIISLEKALKKLKSTTGK